MKAAAARYLCIAGPTASGKSAAALAVSQALAHTMPIEIVSVDSAAVYRDMDIGTAKPSLAEREQVRHHLIDILDPSQVYSAARFATDANALIIEITARGHLPVLVGGTMLYFKALLQGLDAMPVANASVRAELQAQATRDGQLALYAELRQVDPAAAARLPPGDTQRIQRALEVFRVSGKPLSAHHRGKPLALEQPAMIALEPSDRGWLHQRINQRFAKMLGDGLLDEVRRLRSRPDLHADMPSMRCVGYRQAWEALNRGDLSTLAEHGSAATRQLAKRQLTWLRGLPGRRIVACDLPDAKAQVVKAAKELLGRQV